MIVSKVVASTSKYNTNKNNKNIVHIREAHKTNRKERQAMKGANNYKLDTQRIIIRNKNIVHMRAQKTKRTKQQAIKGTAENR